MIYASHGIVTGHLPNKICHRFYLDSDLFKQHIKSRSYKYVKLEEALNGNGEAFTLDDATYASYEAAKLLRNYGHEVTLFINPFYIENKLDYWFSKLNALLDSVKNNRIKFNNKEYILSTYQNKLLFRNELKAEISGLPTEEERYYILEEIFNTNIDSIEIASYAKTIRETDVLELHRLGVNIQNHGWTHRQLIQANETDIVNEIRLGNEWIKKKLHYDSKFYAVPFGSAFPPEYLQKMPFWLLLEGTITPGFKNKNVYNRTGFSLEKV